MLLLERYPVRRQMLTVASLVLIPLMAAVLWSANRTRLERQAEVLGEAAAIAGAATALLDQSFDALHAFAALAVRDRALLALHREESNRLFASVLPQQPLLTGMVLTDMQGVPVGSAPEPAVASSRPINNPDLRRVIRTGMPVIGRPASDPATGKPTLVLAYPVRAEGSLVGVLGLSVNLARLQSELASIPLPEGSLVTVTDRSGVVVAASREIHRRGPPEAADLARQPGWPSAPFLRVDLDGVERFFSEKAVGHGEWTLGVGIPRAVVRGRLIALRRRNALLAASIIVAFLMPLLWMAQMTASNLDRLCTAAQRIADGDLSPPTATHVPSLEFGRLQNAFVNMAARLREARDALDQRMRQDHKTNETLHSLQRQVVRQERLAAVGLLVSGVAHELNNPLQAIVGTSELLERKPGLSREVLNEIAFVKTQSGRAREIIRNLSRFSAQQSGEATVVDLRQVIAEVVQLRRVDLEHAGIALEVLPKSQRRVLANFTELEQVTLNFVINAQQAIEASETKGRISIRLFDVEKKVRLEVLDNGRGVAPADESKLFQPFFTTKPVGKGTGLGLSVSYGIIDSYGGAIGYRGNEWGGATFFFELPAVDTAGDPHDDRSTLLHGPV